MMTIDDGDECSDVLMMIGMSDDNNDNNIIYPIIRFYQYTSIYFFLYPSLSPIVNSSENNT